MASRHRKDGILNLKEHMDKKVRVKFTGGREVVGTLKGYDQLVNIVLDDAVEFLRDAEDASILTDATRELGLLVCRGTSVMLVCPEDGTEEISNPFVQTEAAELEGED